MLRLLSRLLSVILILIVVVALVLGGVGFLIVRRSFPEVSGEIQVPGLTAPVEVYRDGYGVPHIYAQTSHDLFMAQGYVHAQDRFWQMDFWRHIGSGRLAELFGESQVETDAFLRTLGWARVVEKEVLQLDPVSREILESYTEGVNAYLAEHKGAALSLEYAVLKLQNGSYQPEPWQPLHTLTWAKAMAFDLGGNMEYEQVRAVLLKTLSPEQVETFFPPYPDDHPVIVPDFQVALLQTEEPVIARSERLLRATKQSPITRSEIATASTRGGASGQTTALAMTSFLVVHPESSRDPAFCV